MEYKNSMVFLPSLSHTTLYLSVMFQGGVFFAYLTSLNIPGLYLGILWSFCGIIGLIAT